MSVLGDSTHTALVGELLNELLEAVRKGHTPTLEDVNYAMREAEKRGTSEIGAMLGDAHSVLRPDIAVKPRTHGQRTYLDAIRTHEIVVVIGPAGTGKTHLAMAAAVSALLSKEVHRLVLTRPAVEAGENLGFLPGDLAEKVNPYLRPLFDALYSMVDRERARKWFDREQVEVAPLAFMRGRTLNHCFALLDEAQNTTPHQMKMFLTRLGEGSRAIITGDITQIDLPKGATSGLIQAKEVLRNTEGVKIIELSKADVVRHQLVQDIVDAYEHYDRRQIAPSASNLKSDPHSSSGGLPTRSVD